jgi:hypothetical protein
LTRSAITLLLGGGVLVAIAGCGSGTTFANHPRPPAPIVVSAAITRSGVTVSPNHFGAGIVQLDVANLTGRSQQLTLQSVGSPSFQQQTGPINPQDTAELKANLATGQYSIAVTDPSVKAATLAVGAPRPSSQNQLLQP